MTVIFALHYFRNCRIHCSFRYYIYMESRLRSEHLYSKTATIGTFFKSAMIMLHLNVPYYLLEIFRYLCTTKCFKKYRRLQIYGLYVPISDETLYIVTKCTVVLAILRNRAFSPAIPWDSLHAEVKGLYLLTW